MALTKFRAFDVDKFVATTHSKNNYFFRSLKLLTSLHNVLYPNFSFFLQNKTYFHTQMIYTLFKDMTSITAKQKYITRFLLIMLQLRNHHLSKAINLNYPIIWVELFNVLQIILARLILTEWFQAVDKSWTTLPSSFRDETFLRWYHRCRC